MLCFQLCSAHFTALQTKNSRGSTSAVTMEIQPIYKSKEAIALATMNQHLGLSAKIKMDTKENKGKSMMHALYVLQCMSQEEMI